MTEQKAYENALNGLKNANIKIDDEIRYPAIKAIEKQIPNKPTGNDECICPSCNTHNDVIRKRRNTVPYDIVYCWHCGQAMKINRLE